MGVAKVALGCAVLAVVAHLNAMPNGFTFDDVAAVNRNADVLGTTPVESLLHNDFWGRAMNDKGSHKSWRPLTTLTYRMQCAWHTLENHTPFRAVNIAMHALATALVVLLAARMTNSNAGGGADDESQRFDDDDDDDGKQGGAKSPRHVQSAGGDAAAYAAYVPVAAGILFALHPIHTEAVSGNMVGRAETLCCVFLLLAVLVAALEEEQPASKPVRGNRSSAALVGRVLLSALAFLAACLSKETGFTGLAVIPVFAVCRAQTARRGRGDAWRALPRLMCHLVPMAAIAAALLAWRYHISSPFLTPKIFGRNNHVAREPEWSVRFLTYARINAVYARLLVLPVMLSADYSIDCIRVVRSIADRENAATLAAATTLAAVLVLAARGRLGRAALPATLWVLATFAPASQTIVTAATVVGERLLYIPSAGFCILVASAAGRHHSLRAGVAFFAVLFALGTWHRSPDWISTDTIIERVHDVCPRSTAYLQHRAEVARKRGDRIQEIVFLEASIDVFPEDAPTLRFLGDAYRVQLIADTGDKNADGGGKEPPRDPPKGGGEGKAKANAKTKAKAKANAKAKAKAKAKSKAKKDLVVSHGLRYGRPKITHELVRDTFARCADTNPTWVPCWSGAGVVDVFLGNVEAGERRLREALDRDPNCSEALHGMGNAAHLRNDKPDAARWYARHLLVDKNHVLSRSNLAAVLVHLKRYDDARKVYLDGVNLPRGPASAPTSDTRAMWSAKVKEIDVYRAKVEAWEKSQQKQQQQKQKQQQQQQKKQKKLKQQQQKQPGKSVPEKKMKSKK
jgi:hypothetical protein